MTEPLIIHLEPATAPTVRPRLFVAYHGPVALTGRTQRPYTDAAIALAARGTAADRVLISRRRGDDRNLWHYTIAQAKALALENQQPELPIEPPTWPPAGD
ncbi:MAG: hypothetical protein J2P16_01155 [Mycobacterium sp.]|nr:hypothetical protein [Mycobacterium sp.]